MLEQADKSNTAELEYAGFWVRVGAWIIDLILFLLVYVLVGVPLILLIGFVFAELELGAGTSWLAGFVIGFISPPLIIITFWFKKQATPGKMFFSAKIVDAETGGNPSLKQCVGRYLVLWVPNFFVTFLSHFSFIFLSLLSGLVAFLVILWVVFDKRKQGWHDKLAGTVVIRNKKQNAPEPVSFS